MLTQSLLKEWLHYEPTTGVFTWLKQPSSNIKAGEQAGWLHLGYKKISLLKTHYCAHNLAWLYVHGVLPTLLIDHINNIKDDNAIVNLRLATYSQNGMNRGAPSNNTSGYKGVHWNAQKQSWVAAITHNGAHIYVCSCDSPEEAHIRYCAKGVELFGEYFNPGYGATPEDILLKEKELALPRIKTRRDNVSGYPGVGWHSQRQLWRARHKGVHVGFFESPECANRAIQALT